MEFQKPDNLNDLLNIIDSTQKKYLFLAGGSDINIDSRKNQLENEEILFINHLAGLKGIKETEKYISIGSATTFLDILDSPLIEKYFPFFQDSLKKFASHLIQGIATLGGNIANGSPTADSIPLLLVLDAELELISKKRSRIIELKDFFTGYKKNILSRNEIIKRILIPKNAEFSEDTFYKKISSRNSLAIAKLSLAGLKKIENGIIKKIKIATGALNEYPRRLNRLESYLIYKEIKEIRIEFLKKNLKKEITPITDLRSDEDYRFKVCLNLINNFLNN